MTKTGTKAGKDSENVAPGNDFLQQLTGGHRATIARAITVAERGGSKSAELLKQVFPYTGKAHRVGITGPPGAGKSTLISEIAKILSNKQKKVGIIAVDPTSPFTSGAVLGDRVRMEDIESNPRVFIRSMASRGHAGGLSSKTSDAADILDAAGFDYIFIETVGVGQVELEIEKVVDTTLVVLVPESGDLVQAIKAGLMEIADIYILNKSDRPGSNAMLNSLQTAINFRGKHNHDWSPKIFRTIASKGEGLIEMEQEIGIHLDFLHKNDLAGRKRRQRLETRVRNLVAEFLSHELWDKSGENMLSNMLMNTSESPQVMAEMIIDNFKENNRHKN